MADTIGPVTLQRVSTVTRNRQHIIVTGDVGSQGVLNSLDELFAKTEGGSAIHIIPGGLNLGEDNTDTLRNTHYCTFGDPNVPDGWYLLRSFQRGEEGPIFFEFSIELYFMGSEAIYLPAFLCEGLGQIENDWDI